MARIKKPQPGKAKNIRQAEDAKGTGNLHPAFSFQYMATSHNLHDCQSLEKASLAEALFKLSCMTWDDINSSGRHKLGCEKISQDCIKAPIPKGITPDVTFLAFRFHHKAPMVGFRRGQIFFIIWLDRDFTLYRH